MQGRRVKFRRGWPGPRARRGSYCGPIPAGIDPRGEGIFYVVDPTGGAGAITPQVHTVTEHDDATITATPSLVMPSGWHGFLERGVWREV